MTPTKYRAYPKSKSGESKMLYRGLFDKNWYYSESGDCDCAFPITQNDNYFYEVMQSSGIKCKNGGEVYDGDIGKDSKGIIAPVHFESGCFWFGSVLLLKHEDDLEILGDIHQNSDLI